MFTDEQKENFRKLESLRDSGLTHLTLEILRHRSKMESSFAAMFRQTCIDLAETLNGQPIEDRILNNWAVPLAAYRCLETTLRINLPYTHLFDSTVRGIRTQNAECKTSSELGNFWNAVQYLIAQGEIIESGDYRIKYLQFFKSDRIQGIHWQEKHPVLFLQKTRIFMLYKHNGKNVGDVVIPEESLKYYLEHSKAFLGEKLVHYRLFNKGIVVYDKDKPNGKNGYMEAETVQRSYCFDYQKLVETFDINLERANSDTLDDDEKEKMKKAEQVLPFQ